jgi:hypothetical protein
MTTVRQTAHTILDTLRDLVWRVRQQELAARELCAIEQRCRALLDELAPTIRWDRVADAAALSSLIGTQRGRPIRLEVVGLPLDLSGLWLPGTSEDYIFCCWDTVPALRGHVILHELSHILCGHRALVADAEAVLRPEFPLLDSDAIRRKLGRSRYDTRSEREAEMLATMLERQWEAARPNARRAGDQDAADSDHETRRLRRRLDDFTSKLHAM